MNYIVYIIQSLKNSKIYIGHTNHIDGRLHRHNTGQVLSTKSGIPWQLLSTEKFKTRSEAVKRENYLKSLKNKKYLIKLLNN